MISRPGHDNFYSEVERQRWQRQRRKTIGLMSKNNRSARWVLNFGTITFLCRPLQNSNVK